jgi:hypothetical protein
MPSSRFNAGAMTTEGGWDTKLLCGRGCGGFEKEKCECTEEVQASVT